MGLGVQARNEQAIAARTRKYRGAWREVSGQRATMRRDRPAAMMPSTISTPFMRNGTTGPIALRHQP